MIGPLLCAVIVVLCSIFVEKYIEEDCAREEAKKIFREQILEVSFIPVAARIELKTELCGITPTVRDELYNIYKDKDYTLFSECREDIQADIRCAQEQNIDTGIIDTLIRKHLTQENIMQKNADGTTLIPVPGKTYEIIIQSLML